MDQPVFLPDRDRRRSQISDSYVDPIVVLT